VTEAVLYLEADDEVTSVVRRVRSADADRVIVIVPGRSRATSSAVALRLLARAGEEQGREIAVVGDALTRSLAAEAGLPAHATLDEARSADAPSLHEPADGRHATIHVVRGTDDTVSTPALAPVDEMTRPVPVAARPAGTRPRRRIAPVILAVIAIALVLAVGLAGAALLPGATVTIDPLTETVGPAPYVVEIDQPEELSGIAEAAATVTATGQYEIEEPATGSVVLFNWSAVDQPIAAGTLVAAGEQAFETVVEVVVPRGSLTPQGTIEAGEVAVGIIASAPGPAGNVAVAAIDTVLSEGADARLQGFPENGQPRVTNPEATAGGVDDAGLRITRSDVNAAVEALSVDLRSQVGDAVAAEADQIVVQPALAEPTITGLDGLIGTRDQAEATIEGSLAWEAWSVERADVLDAARQQIVDDPQLVPEGRSLDPDSIDVAIEEANVEAGTMRVDVTATGISVARVDTDNVAQRVAGLTPAEAEAALDDLGSVTVELWPDWAESVPDMPWRIDVLVNAP
jgi:hypothetical protein